MSEDTAIDLPSAPESAPLGTPLDQAGPDLRVRLPVFEGPLDLLLYLIKKDELDIYDIPVEHITKQYLSYLQFMKMLDLEVAGEFLVVASTLLYIKSRTLLPKDQQPPEDEAEEDDPRWDLIRQLVEYKKFKDAAWQLHMKQLEQGKTFQRGAEIILPERAEGGSTVGDLGIFDLINAFQKILDRVNQKEDLKEIFEERFTVSDKINTIQQMMSNRERIFFEDLFIDVASRTEIVVTFLALLELIRMKFLCVTQADPFAEIEISHAHGGTPLFQTPSAELIEAVAHEEVPASLSGEASETAVDEETEEESEEDEEESSDSEEESTEETADDDAAEASAEVATEETTEESDEPVSEQPTEPTAEATAPVESEVELEPTDFPEERGTVLLSGEDFADAPADSEPTIIVEAPQAEESEEAAIEEDESREKHTGEPAGVDRNDEPPAEVEAEESDSVPAEPESASEPTAEPVAVETPDEPAAPDRSDETSSEEKPIDPESPEEHSAK